MAPRSSSRAGLVAQALVVLVGVGFLVLAWRCDLAWFERRWALDSDHAFVEWIWRTVGALAGAALLVRVRPSIGDWVDRVGPAEAAGACARQAIALVLALGASELGLRVLGLPRKREPVGAHQGEPHPRYGWVFKASQSITAHQGGRDVTYAFDADHDRAPSVDAAVDPKLPSILFAGESLTAGHGLTWDESYPALVGRALGLQVVNLGVDGYGSDQAFLRLADALPRFEHPVAILTLFIPSMVDRLANDDHPRLVFDGVEPRVVPPRDPWRALHLVRAFRDAVLYRSEDELRLAGTIFRETGRLATERGARAVFVTPCLRAEWPRGDGYLVDALLREQGLVVVDPDFHFEGIPGDNHPNAASTRRLADAVIATLRAELAR